MQFPSPLKRGRLVQRYKRFLADVILDDGSAITASCPNTGSMLGLTAPGSTIWLSHSASPTRKYAHTWEMIETDLGHGTTLVGIDTGLPNRIVSEAIAARKIESLQGYSTLRREVKYGYQAASTSCWKIPRAAAATSRSRTSTCRAPTASPNFPTAALNVASSIWPSLPQWSRKATAP